MAMADPETEVIALDGGFQHKADSMVRLAGDYFRARERMTILQKEIEATGNNVVRKTAMRDLLLQRAQAATAVAEQVVDLLRVEGVSL